MDSLWTYYGLTPKKGGAFLVLFFIWCHTMSIKLIKKGTVKFHSTFFYFVISISVYADNIDS